MKQLLVLAAIVAATYAMVRGSGDELRSAEVEMRESLNAMYVATARRIAVELLMEIAKASQGRGDAAKVSALRDECETLKRDMEAGL